jgi:hypothetical protein
VSIPSHRPDDALWKIGYQTFQTSARPMEGFSIKIRAPEIRAVTEDRHNVSRAIQLMEPARQRHYQGVSYSEAVNHTQATHESLMSTSP